MAERSENFIDVPPSRPAPTRPVAAQWSHLTDSPPVLPDDDTMSENTVWTLRMDDRAPIQLDEPVLVGRAPGAVSSHPDAIVVPIDDPGRSVSKTHTLIDPVDGVLIVHDLDSTNGVWVVPDGGEAIEVHPDTPLRVRWPSRIELGDFTMRVDPR